MKKLLFFLHLFSFISLDAADKVAKRCICTKDGEKKVIFCHTTSSAGISCETCCDIHFSKGSNVKSSLREIEQLIKKND